ncbi:MAG: hypothetical protein IPP76_12680 [Moraxellaceae bacterium]|nr:hypothetical protein [Moraxellaceae bacterium]
MSVCGLSSGLVLAVLIGEVSLVIGSLVFLGLGLLLATDFLVALGLGLTTGFGAACCGGASSTKVTIVAPTWALGRAGGLMLSLTRGI